MNRSRGNAKAIITHTLAVPLACLALTPAADAVSLSQNGAGQVLLYPYYTVQGTNNTLFSVANPFLITDEFQPT